MTTDPQTPTTEGLSEETLKETESLWSGCACDDCYSLEDKKTDVRFLITELRSARAKIAEMEKLTPKYATAEDWAELFKIRSKGEAE